MFSIPPHGLASRTLTLAAALAIPASIQAAGQQSSQLEARIAELEQALATAKAELQQAREEEQTAQGELDQLKLQVADTIDPGIKQSDVDKDIGGTLNIGGAIRANYAFGDYGAKTGAPSRAEGDNGNMTLDTFRVNLDYSNGDFLAKAEYRFYNGTNMLHTGWLGYNFDNGGQVQIGVNRVPFGPGPYGVSQSWFFDQHYYVGLSDDMDLGIKYSHPLGDWAFDIAYYYSDEGNWAGSSRDSARYSYDVVNESGNGYEERNQFNLRGIYSLANSAIPTDIGFSLQYGQLDSKGRQDDGDHYAVSAHMINKWNNFKLATQLTRYGYDVDAMQSLGTARRVQFGAFDFPSTAAAEGWIPAASLSYYYATPSLDWLDYVTPYVEYSAILKDESSFNDSELATIGAAWSHGGWYIYTEVAYSNGNEFVGGETAFGDRLGANADNDWLYRLNVNLGYYF